MISECTSSDGGLAVARHLIVLHSESRVKDKRCSDVLAQEPLPNSRTVLCLRSVFAQRTVRRCQQVSHVPGGCIAASTRSFASGVSRIARSREVDFKGWPGSMPYYGE